jgi:hypothetical protein
LFSFISDRSLNIGQCVIDYILLNSICINSFEREFEGKKYLLVFFRRHISKKGKSMYICRCVGRYGGFTMDFLLKIFFPYNLYVQPVREAGRVSIEERLIGRRTLENFCYLRCTTNTTFYHDKKREERKKCLWKKIITLATGRTFYHSCAGKIIKIKTGASFQKHTFTCKVLRKCSVGIFFCIKHFVFFCLHM